MDFRSNSLKFILFISCWFTQLNCTFSQEYIGGIYSRWSDSFAAWEIVDEEEEIVGFIEQLWMNQNNWKEWRIEVFEQSGIIRQKWRDDPNLWEIRIENEIVTAQTRWGNDRRNWRITDNEITLNLECKYGNNISEWIVEDKTLGTFTINTINDNDPRDWYISDQLDESVSLPMKTAIVFLTVFNSAPKQ